LTQLVLNFSRVRLYSSLLSQDLLLRTIQQPATCAPKSLSSG